MTVDVYALLIAITVLAPTVTFVSELLTNVTKVDGGWSQVQAGIVSVLLLLGADQFEITTAFAELDLGWRLGLGVLTGLIANGLFDITLIQTILEKLKIKNS